MAQIDSQNGGIMEVSPSVLLNYYSLLVYCMSGHRYSIWRLLTQTLRLLPNSPEAFSFVSRQDSIFIRARCIASAEATMQYVQQALDAVWPLIEKAVKESTESLQWASGWSSCVDSEKLCWKYIPDRHWWRTKSWFTATWDSYHVYFSGSDSAQKYSLLGGLRMRDQWKLGREWLQGLFGILR